MNLYNANQNTYISNNDMPAVARLNIIFWYMYFFMFIPLLLLYFCIYIIIIQGYPHPQILLHNHSHLCCLHAGQVRYLQLPLLPVQQVLLIHYDYY